MPSATGCPHTQYMPLVLTLARYYGNMRWLVLCGFPRPFTVMSVPGDGHARGLWSPHAFYCYECHCEGERSGSFNGSQQLLVPMERVSAIKYVMLGLKGVGDALCQRCVRACVSVCDPCVCVCACVSPLVRTYVRACVSVQRSIVNM